MLSKLDVFKRRTFPVFLAERVRHLRTDVGDFSCPRFLRNRWLVNQPMVVELLCSRKVLLPLHSPLWETKSPQKGLRPNLTMHTSTKQKLVNLKLIRLSHGQRSSRAITATHQHYIHWMDTLPTSSGVDVAKSPKPKTIASFHWYRIRTSARSDVQEATLLPSQGKPHIHLRCRNATWSLWANFTVSTWKNANLLWSSRLMGV